MFAGAKGAEIQHGDGRESIGEGWRFGGVRGEGEDLEGLDAGDGDDFIVSGYAGCCAGGGRSVNGEDIGD